MVSRNQINIAAYDATANEYDSFSELYSLEREYGYFIDLMGRSSGDVLDIGCGAGRDSRELSNKGYSVTGIDLSDNMLTIAKRKAPKAIFSKMDLRDLNFRDNTFDGVWASASMFHVTKDEVIESLKGILRVLKPAGVAFISFKEGEGVQVKQVKKTFQKKQELYSYTEMRDTLRNLGFRVLMTERKEDATREGLFWLNYFVKKPN